MQEAWEHEIATLRTQLNARTAAAAGEGCEGGGGGAAAAAAAAAAARPAGGGEGGDACSQEEEEEDEQQPQEEEEEEEEETKSENLPYQPALRTARLITKEGTKIKNVASPE